MLARFHGGIYTSAFGAQCEPLSAWLRALRGEAAYELTIMLARDGDEIAGGIAYELYPRSRCGLVTYMAVAPNAGRTGLGKRLLDDAVAALRERGARAVFGEVNDPRRIGQGTAHETAEATWTRLERNQRWGARVADVRFVQPALGEGLQRDRGLCLLVLGTNAISIEGAIVRGFVVELFAVTERMPPDRELQDLLAAIPSEVPLVTLVR